MKTAEGLVGRCRTSRVDGRDVRYGEVLSYIREVTLGPYQKTLGPGPDDLEVICSSSKSCRCQHSTYWKDHAEKKSLAECCLKNHMKLSVTYLGEEYGVGRSTTSYIVNEFKNKTDEAVAAARQFYE